MLDLKIVLLLSSLVVSTLCADGDVKKSVLVKRSGYGDQIIAASGYAYHSTGDGPVRYSSYNLGNGNLPNVPAPLLVHSLQPLKPVITSYEAPIKVPNDYFSVNPQEGLRTAPWIPPYGYNLPHHNYHHYAPFGRPLNIYDHHKYAKGSGSKHDEFQKASNGEKGENGYKTEQNHHKNSEGEHLKEGHKEHYAKNGGNAENNQNVAGYHSSQSEAAKGARGGSFHESNGHRKGHKTTGFHKVYHKDEYKKDHSFYDEKDSNGHHDKYEKGNSQYGKESGAFEKGGHGKNAYEQSNYGAEGFKDEGKYLNADKGHEGQQADSAYYKNNENFAKKQGHQHQDANGYAVSDDD